MKKRLFENEKLKLVYIFHIMKMFIQDFFNIINNQTMKYFIIINLLKLEFIKEFLL